MRIVVVAALIFAGLSVSGHASSDKRGHDRNTLVLEWNEVTLEAVRQSSLGPPATARALGIVSTCIYDAWAAYDWRALAAHSGAALRQPARERTRRHQQMAISYAAYRALVDLFPAQQPLFDDFMSGRELDPLAGVGDLSTPAGVGWAACGAVLDDRHHDGSNQLGDLNGGAPYSDYTGYVPVNTATALTDPNRWQPITFTNGTTPGYLSPHWGLVKPFAADPARIRPAPPAFYPSAEYTRQAEEIVSLSANLTDREKVVAEYWADGPRSELPPGHWNLFAQVVSKRDHHSLRDDVIMFFALNNAVMDAGIASWECKGHYDYVRPFTAVRFLFAGQQIEAWAGPGLGTRSIDGATWLPFQPGNFITPPFAEYVSGHSTFSSAAARILEAFTRSERFGYGVEVPAGASRVEPGLTPREPVRLYWPTFDAAAREAGYSRLVGGIHFQDGNEAGRVLGSQVGRAVWKRVMRLVNGLP